MAKTILDSLTFETKLPDGCRARTRTTEAVGAFAELPRSIRMHLIRTMLFCSLAFSTGDGAGRGRLLQAARKARDAARDAIDVLAADHCPDGLHEPAFEWMRVVVDGVGIRPRFRALIAVFDDFIAHAGSLDAEADGAWTYIDTIYEEHNGYLIALTEAADVALAAYRREEGGRIQDAMQRASQVAAEVNEIAFNVGLIALNAQVEAAHAGRYGQAFGVIASEIRALSERAQAASGRNADTLGDMARMLEG